MKRHTITLGATTTAGGKVISASSAGSIDGVKIALENDQIFCPACKSVGQILAIGPRLTDLWNGKQVALENDLCICGCYPHPRLIANQTLRCQVISDTKPESTYVPAKREKTSVQSGPPVTTSDKDGSYDLYFVVKNEAGHTLSDWKYTIEMSNGARLEGATDAEGKTKTVGAADAEFATLIVYAPETKPIDPNWDR